MRIFCGKDYADMSRKAANLVSAQLLLKPDSVLGFASGSTPLGMYEELVARCRLGDLDFSGASAVSADEYRGLPPENRQSYRYYMDAHLYDHVNIRKERTFLPDGMAEDSAAACADYEALIRRLGGVDLQVLGVGHNGHIGFNEPGPSFPDETHLVNLAASTVAANRRFFDREEDVPRQALTIGVGTILRARRVLLMVSGSEKADVIKRAFAGPITPELPASALRLHRDVVLVGDEAALSELLAAHAGA